MENSSRLGSEDQWKPASILEENVGRKENFGSTRKGIKEHEQSEKCLKEEINSNRKINNQILGAEKEVERVVVVVECSADCRHTTRRGWRELRCRGFCCCCCFYLWYKI